MNTITLFIKKQKVELNLLVVYTICMGSNIHLKNKAISLRKSGKSYNNIRKTLGITSKGTLSHWFKNIKLSKKSTKLLDKNNKLFQERSVRSALFNFRGWDLIRA